MESPVRASNRSILIDALSLNPDREALSASLGEISGPEQWSALVRQATRARVSGLLKRGLADLGLSPGMPESAAVALHRHAAGLHARYENHKSILRDIHVALTGGGLPYAIFKGPALVETVYGDPTLRPFADHDLLVERGRVKQAAALLGQIGYCRSGPLPDDYYLRFHLQLNFARERGEATVDMHWSFAGPYDLATVPYEQVIGRSRPLDNGTLPNPVLAPMDHLLANVIHLHKHLGYLRPLLGHPCLPQVLVGSRNLILLCDFMRLTRGGVVTSDSAEIKEEATRWNVFDKLNFCADLCAELWGESQHPFPELATRRPNRRRATWLRSWLFLSHQERLEKQLPLVGIRPARLLTLKEAFFPPWEALAKYYAARRGHPHRLWWRVVHPVRVTTFMTRNALSFLRLWLRLRVRSLLR